MPISRIIEVLDVLKAEVEWDFSLDYQIALEETIQILKDIENKEDDVK